MKRLSAPLLIVLIYSVLAQGCTQQAAMPPRLQKPVQRSSLSDRQDPTFELQVESTNGIERFDPETGQCKGSGIQKHTPIKVKSGDRLGWVDRAIETYPPDRYRTGLGMAPNRRTAEQRSMTELQKPLALAIDIRMKKEISKLKRISASTGQDVKGLATECQRTVLTTVLADGHIVDIFFDKLPQKTFYALAVLNHQTARQRLTPLIRQVDQQLSATVARLQKSDSTSPAEKSALVKTYLYRQALDAALGGSDLAPTVNASTIIHIVN